MQEEIRLAKLMRPAPTAAFPRTRLFDALQNRMTAAPVVWLAGPPGSGKTTLIANYIASHGIPCLWYQMDRGDADVASFFHYFSAALHRHVGEHPLPMFQPEYMADIEAFARNFFREVFRRLTSPLLVFDNFNDVANEARLSQVLQQALIELPDDGHVMVLSRNDPPAAFASLRARGKIELIGWNDLRLTLQECRGIAEVRGVPLSGEQLELIHGRTQGWAAGVMLMLQDVRSGNGVMSRNVSAVPTVIFDYLAEEIYQKLPPALRESLLQLAYLPQVTPSMAEKLGIDAESRAALVEFGRSDFFATMLRVEPEPIWQLHPLLQEFLLAHAEDTGSPQQVELRKRTAALALAETGHIEAAAVLLTRIRDWSSLRRVITANAADLLHQGRAALLDEWLSALPAGARDEDPHLLHWMGACRIPYAPRESRDLFMRACQRFENVSPVDVAGILGAITGVFEAVLYDSADDYSVLDPWIEAANRWTRDLTEWPSAELEAKLTCYVFTAAALRQPMHPRLYQWRAQVQAISETQRDQNIRMTLDSSLIVLAAWNGQFAAAERALNALGELPDSALASPVAAMNVAQAAATFYMLCGDRDRCLKAVHSGLETATRTGVRLWNDTFLANALCGVLSEGDLDAAGEYLARIEADPAPPRRFDVFLRAYGTAWYAMLRGDAFLAHQHLKRAARAANEVGLPAFQALASLALSQVLMNAADEAGAERELSRATQLTAALNNRLFEFMTWMCRASFALLRGNETAANEALRAGFVIGRERGLTYHLWWQPRVMAGLMQHALAHNIESEYVARLIEKRGLAPPAGCLRLASWPWPYRIRAFGSFQLQIHQRVEAGGKRAVRPLELLQTLVAAGGKSVRLQQLAEMLWPRIDADYAYRSLNTTLHRLRKLLGNDAALVVQGGTLSLNESMFWVDIWAFDEACATVSSGIAGQSAPADLLRAAHHALDLYAGPLFEQESDAAWVIAPREQRRGQLLRIVDSVFQALEGGELRQEAADLYRRAIDCEPCVEVLYRKAMVALSRNGRTLEAIEIYHSCVAALQARLRSEPAPITSEIYRSLVSA